jgi:flagellar protein FlgJ
MNTWEVFSGSSTVVNDAFRAYHNIFELVDDHGHFLRDNPRYASAFKAADDPREFARRIHAAGYATDPDYCSKLIKLMDRYDLYQYDLPIP